MTKNENDDIPLLTDQVCPGDELLKRGLWLPRRQEVGAAAPETSHQWRERLPPELQDRGDLILQAVMKRLDKDQ